MIEIENLTKTFGTQTVISDVSGIFYPGKIQREFHSEYENTSQQGMTSETATRFGCHFIYAKKTHPKVRSLMDKA